MKGQHLLESADFDSALARHFAPARFCEPAEQLGDTHPGDLDESPLVEHPAVIHAREDLRLPRWVYVAGVLWFVVVLIASSFYPWGFAAAP